MTTDYPVCHWFEAPAIQFRVRESGARRPEGLREWLRCARNADVFFGAIPFLKAVCLASFLIAWLA